MSNAKAEQDVRPVPPERPGDNECCQSGCVPCVFDLYYEEMDVYRAELRAWEARRTQAAGQRTDDASGAGAPAVGTPAA